MNSGSVGASLLAKGVSDSGVPVDIFTGYKVAIGGKPAPTLTSFTSGERHG